MGHQEGLGFNPYVMLSNESNNVGAREIYALAVFEKSSTLNYQNPVSHVELVTMATQDVEKKFK